MACTRSESCNVSVTVLFFMFQTLFVSLSASDLHLVVPNHLLVNCMHMHANGLFTHKAEITAAIINCLSNHMTDLSAVMNLLATGSQYIHQSIKPYQTCLSSFASAKQELKQAAMKLMNHNYIGADESMNNVLVYNFQCKNAITQGTFSFTSTIVSKLKMVEQLCQAAKTAIHSHS